MASNKKIVRYPISEWESRIKDLPITIELIECSLVDNKVNEFAGYGQIGRKKRYLIWAHNGKCYYKGHRISDLDVKFNTGK